MSVTLRTKFRVGGVQLQGCLRSRGFSTTRGASRRASTSAKMFPTIIRRTAQQTTPFIYTNPYKAKRLWPPDFTKLSPKHQFRLERRYKRRAKLKWARPRWTKAVKIAQMASITCRCEVYGVTDVANLF